MTRLKGTIAALAAIVALALACFCTRAADDDYSVRELPTAPAVTNAASFVQQATNDAPAVLPKGLLFVDEIGDATNRDDLAAAAMATNAQALLDAAARMPDPDASADAAESATNALAAATNALEAATNELVVAAPPSVTAEEMTNLVHGAVDGAVKQAAMDAVVEAVNAVNAAADKVAETERRRRISTRTFMLKYASAEDVAARLNGMWSGDFGTVWKVARIAQAFPEANAVVVTAPGPVRRTMTMSPSSIPAFIILSPRTRRAKRSFGSQPGASNPR